MRTTAGTGWQLQPGEVVGSYRVIAPLGRGGMAEVYTVEHVLLGSRHVLKLMTNTSPAWTERLMREGQAQARLSHPHIVKVTDAFFHGEQLCLVMELVVGAELTELIVRGPSLAMADHLARQLMAGIAHAHAHGLVHRDLKPSNVLCEQGDGEWVAKVADFGLVKEVGAVGQTKSLTAMGTPSYMAPEQIRNAKAVDARADVWSLGVVLYELVTGRRPFDVVTDGEFDLLETFSRIGAGRFAPPSAHRAVPARMEQAILRSLVVDREQRVASVGELLALWSGEEVPPEVVPLAVGDVPAPDDDLEPTADGSGEVAATFPPVGTGDTLAPEGASTWTAPEPEVGDVEAPRTVWTRDVPAQPTSADTMAPVADRPNRRETAWRVWGLAVGTLAVLSCAGATLGGGVMGVLTVPWMLPVAAPPVPEPQPVPSPRPEPSAPAPEVVPEPEPEVAPAPETEIEAAPEVEPEPEVGRGGTEDAPPPPPPPPTTGTVRRSGDVTKVYLTALDEEAHPLTDTPTALEPGSYTVNVQVFDGGPPHIAGTLVLDAGQDIALGCSRLARTCTWGEDGGGVPLEGVTLATRFGRVITLDGQAADTTTVARPRAVPFEWSLGEDRCAGEIAVSAVPSGWRVALGLDRTDVAPGGRVRFQCVGRNASLVGR